MGNFTKFLFVLFLSKFARTLIHAEFHLNIRVFHLNIAC